jgi:hypothetical protein
MTRREPVQGAGVAVTAWKATAADPPEGAFEWITRPSSPY